MDAVAPQAELFVIRYSGLGVRFSQVLFEFYFFLVWSYMENNNLPDILPSS